MTAFNFTNNNKENKMSFKYYTPFKAETIGNTVSCHTLERMLNGIRNSNLNERIVAHINRFFAKTKKISLAIPYAETRKEVGQLLLNDVKNSETSLFDIPTSIENVIRNVKYAYVKDMFINNPPLNYKRETSNVEHENEVYDVFIVEGVVVQAFASGDTLNGIPLTTFHVGEHVTFTEFDDGVIYVSTDDKCVEFFGTKDEASKAVELTYAYEAVATFNNGNLVSLEAKNPPPRDVVEEPVVTDTTNDEVNFSPAKSVSAVLLEDFHDIKAGVVFAYPLSVINTDGEQEYIGISDKHGRVNFMTFDEADEILQSKDTRSMEELEEIPSLLVFKYLCIADCEFDGVKFKRGDLNQVVRHDVEGSPVVITIDNNGYNENVVVKDDAEFLENFLEVGFDTEITGDPERWYWNYIQQYAITLMTNF
jgi:hypothetical protein